MSTAHGVLLVVLLVVLQRVSAVVPSAGRAIDLLLYLGLAALIVVALFGKATH